MEDGGESHSPLTRRSVQISVLRRAVNTRRRIKLTWRAGRQRGRCQGAGHCSGPCPRLPALPALTHGGPGQRGAARSALPGAAGGKQPGAGCPGTRHRTPWGPGEEPPNLNFPSGVGAKPTPSLANSQTTRSPSFPPIRDPPPSSPRVRGLGAGLRGARCALEWVLDAALATSPRPPKKTTVPQA